jgi:DNA mismatch endonuclease, patch repair protein
MVTLSSLEKRGGLRRSRPKLARKSGRPRLITSPARSALMARVRQIGTSPELAVRALLRDLGIKTRNNSARLPGSPDLYDPGRRVAIFVHGCFWHRHRGCRACTSPKNNAEYWTEKFKQNVARDRRKSSELRQLGYRVLTVWECQVKSTDKLARLARRLDKFFRQ